MGAPRGANESNAPPHIGQFHGTNYPLLPESVALRAQIDVG
jgi:hypothetical protein